MTPSEARERIAALGQLNAFISLTEEEGEGPVVAVKDLVDVRGTVTTAGGRMLAQVPAAEDAPLVRRMREFGCVVIGKANLHEWAFGVTSSNPHYGAVRNPRDPERIPGGSSGGSAAAVAAGMCDWAVGSDTGGSIRIPAALCGVVGFKPTIGRVDTSAVFPLSHSLDTVGPLAPDVRSAARALEMMSELTGLVPPAPRPLGALRVAVPRGWGEDLHPEVGAAWERISSGLPQIDFPERERMAGPAMAILDLEAASLHRRWLEECPEKYGDDVLERLERARARSRLEYSPALLEQARVRVEAEAAMDGWDALLVPATRIPAPRIGEYHDRADLTGYTRPFNTTGQPVIGLPAPAEGLPVGAQVVGHFAEEARLVEVALALEEAWRSLR